VTAAKEQQIPASLAEISEHLRALLADSRDNAREQENVTEKTLRYLNNIAQKR
jgi:hypothetical protein